MRERERERVGGERERGDITEEKKSRRKFNLKAADSLTSDLRRLVCCVAEFSQALIFT